jgi:hypothetical protein
MPGRSGVTVVTNSCVCFSTHEAAGALSARHSLRPLIFWADVFCKNSDASRREDAESYLKLGQRHCDTNAPRSQPSSPGSTGRSSIPETAVMESRGRGVLDTAHARGMTTVARSEATKQSTLPLRGEMDCFACARNDGLNTLHTFNRHRPRRRAIQYSRGVSDKTERPRRTGYPACAGYDDR